MATVALDLETDIRAVSDFRANAAAILAQVKSSGRPVVLTQRGRSAALLIDVGSYQALLDELETLRDILGGLEDAEAGRVTANAAARARVLSRLS